MTIGLSVKADDVPSWTDGGNGCRVGVEVDPAFVAGTDGFLRGENQQNKDIRSNLSFALKGDSVSIRIPGRGFYIRAHIKA